jgi:uncharacterized membrane protein YedE/YeeE
MRASLASFLIGTLFGVGLTISQMIDPAKVIGFLDFAGDWDPTLAVVMASALAVSTAGFALARRRAAPILGGAFQIPTRRDADARLIGGAVVFGLGWGLAGFCPGPAIAALATGLWPVFLFVASMVAGMWVYRLMPE